MSDVQRRQMTTVDSPNVYTLVIDGTFDDCQTIVKQAFNERPFVKNDQFLLAVNSINWVRIIGQICYYFYASLKISEFKLLKLIFIIFPYILVRSWLKAGPLTPSA